MYNTQFQVKYNNIEQELLINCEKNKESEYTKQDVLDICDKLYRDELSSVFLGTETDIDTNSIDYINAEIIKLYDTTLIYTQIKYLIKEVSETCFGNIIKNEESKKTIEHIILNALFSRQLFHITHKCICQQLDSGAIELTLFLQLKYLTNKMFLNCESL